MKKISIIIILIALGATVFMNRVKIRFWVDELLREPVPAPRSAQEFSYQASGNQPAGGNVLPGSVTLNHEEEGALPAEFNLDVPFTSQAPHKEWDEVHEEACEEASVIMVHYFYENKDFSGPDEADREILDFIDFETELLGFFESTSAAELARVIDQYWDYDVDLVYDFSVENIKQAVYNGYPVVVPAAGRILDNPHFQDPGPLYHMLVVKGWKGEHFITNDPGTQHGEDWLYDFDHLLNSTHDWNGGDVENGAKVILIMKPAE
jgi:hypothetical protein